MKQTTLDTNEIKPVFYHSYENEERLNNEVVSVANENNKIRVYTTNICRATQENYEMLLKLYPHIEIELPTKQLTNGNLCRAVLKNLN